MTLPARRVLRVVAGVLAMGASLTALAAVVRADVAQASVTPPPLLADELPQHDPVKMRKVEHAQPADDELLEIDYGSFEGY